MRTKFMLCVGVCVIIRASMIENLKISTAFTRAKFYNPDEEIRIYWCS